MSMMRNLMGLLIVAVIAAACGGGGSGRTAEIALGPGAPAQLALLDAGSGEETIVLTPRPVEGETWSGVMETDTQIEFKNAGIPSTRVPGQRMR